MLVLLLFAELFSSTALEFKYVNFWYTENTVVVDETGTDNLAGQVAVATVHSYPNPTIVFSETYTSQGWTNFVLAGQNFAFNPDSTVSGAVRLGFYGPAGTEVILHADGSSFNPAINPNGALSGQYDLQASHVEVTSPVDVLMGMLVNTVGGMRPFTPVPPVAQTIFGQCSGKCHIQIWGGDTTVPIERTCTDGSVTTVTAGSFTGVDLYAGVTCMWTAPAGHRISGSAVEGDGLAPQLTTFVPPEYFQLVTPVPVNMQYLLFISAGPATCTYDSNSVTLTGVSGVYHARLTSVSAATFVECDMPVTAMGDGRANLIAAPLTTTTTTSATSSTTTDTTTTTATTSSSSTTTPTTATTTSSTTATTSATTFTETTSTATKTTTSATATTTSATATTTSETTTSTTTTSTITTMTSTATTSTTTTSATTATTSTTTTSATTTDTTISTTTTSTTTSTSSATETTTISTTPTPTTTTGTTTGSTTTASTTTTTNSTTTSSTTETTTSSTTTACTTTTTNTTATTTNTTATLTATTTTTPRTTTNLTVAELANRVEALEPALITALVADNLTTVTHQVDGFTLVAVRLNAAEVAMGGNKIVRVGKAAVTVPASIFPHLGLSAEDVVFTLAIVDLTVSTQESEEVAVVLNANLFSLGGRRLDVTGLVDPVKVLMPVNDTAGLQCVFWDVGGSDWATGGMELVSVDGGFVECAATHLTLFAAIVRGFASTFVCSQVTLLSAESVSELGRGDWQRTPGALLFWSLLAVFMLSLSLAAWLDCARRRQGRSNDELLLIPMHKEREEEEEEEEEATAGCVAAGGAWCCWCLSSGIMKDLLDEILSQWVEYFGEIRSLAEGLVGGLELCTCRPPEEGRVAAFVHHVLSKSLVLSARRQVAASSGISGDISTLVMEDEDLFILVRAHRRRQQRDVDLPGGVQAGVSMMTLAREGAWGELHRDLEVKLDTVMEESAHWSSLPGTVWRVFLHQNPFSTCLVHCAFTNSKLRVIFFMMDVVGSIMLTSLFFSASGIPKKRGRGFNCDTDDLVAAEFVGRLLAIGTGSLVVAAIPAMFLGSLCTRAVKKFDREGCLKWRKQLKVWRTQDRIVWIMGVLYLVFCVFFISLFLANVDRKDQGDWLLSCLISIVQDLVVIPLAVALILPLMVTVCLHITSRKRRVAKEELISELNFRFKSKLKMSVSVGRV